MKRLLAISPTPETIVAAAICRDEWDVLVGVTPENIYNSISGSIISGDLAELIVMIEGFSRYTNLIDSVKSLCENGVKVTIIASERKSDVSKVTYVHDNFSQIVENKLLDAVALAYPFVKTRTPLSEELLSFDQQLLTFIRYHLAHYFMLNGDTTSLLKAINGFFGMIVNDDHSISFPQSDVKSIKHFYNMDLPYVEGKSKLCQNLKLNIAKIASTDLNTLIIGESGTGKASVGFFIHDLSELKDQNFVRFSCLGEDYDNINVKLFGYTQGTFPWADEDCEGLVVNADGGTLFLSNIDLMPLRAQALLLKFLRSKSYSPVGKYNEKSVKIRIVASAQPKIIEMIKDGRFLLELYHRIAEAYIKTPSLREVPDDLWTVLRHLVYALYRKGRVIDVKDTLKYFQRRLDILQKYAWPGNIRELVVIIKRYAVLGEDVVKNLEEH